ncbi:hypothetical protein [Streptomyces sp. NPDC016845]|uniref:hypothetical protein n=1 Tax=Streptomyces sp. NPDC016845 TaxID=3364972 RepID=UPI0037B5DEC2
MDAPGLGKLAAALGCLALLSTAGRIALLNIGRPGDTPTETGKWLLQIASVFAGTGVISSVLRQADITRNEREAWAHLLRELITAQDKVQLAIRLLSAHATAKTYFEQIRQLSEVREVLRRITSSPQVHEDAALRGALARMREDLTLLVREYEVHHLPLARQQRLDEEYLTQRLKSLVRTGSQLSPSIPHSLTEPLPAWQMLNDP